jgi:hypothetical protein
MAQAVRISNPDFRESAPAFEKPRAEELFRFRESNCAARPQIAKPEPAFHSRYRKWRPATSQRTARLAGTNPASFLERFGEPRWEDLRDADSTDTWIGGRKGVSRSRSGQNPRPVSTSSLGSPHYFDYQGFRDAIRPQNTTQIPQFPQKDRERNTRGIRDLLAITR